MEAMQGGGSEALTEQGQRAAKEQRGEEVNVKTAGFIGEANAEKRL